MHGRIRGGHRSQQRANVPIRAHLARGHHGLVREGGEHLGVRSGFEFWRAEFQRKQIRRRAAESEPPREEQIAAELLPRRAQFHALVPRRLGEDVPVQVILNHLGRETQELIERLHLVDVAQVDELQRPHLVVDGEPPPRASLVLGQRDGARESHVRGVRLERRARASRGGGGFLARLAAHASAGASHELRPSPRRFSFALRSRLLLEFGEQRAQHLSEIAPAQTFVPVRADGEPDDDVRVAELVRLRGDVLPDEGNREQASAGGHPGASVCLLQRLHVLGAEQAVRHAVDLGEHVRQERGEPIPREVDHLQALVLRLAFDHLRRLRRALGPGEVRAHVMLGDAPRRAVRAKPQFGPLRQERRQLGFIPRLVEQHHVGLRLDPLGRDGGVDARGDAFENLSRLVGTLRLLGGGATKTHAEDGVEDEEGKFPSQAVAGARFGKVEGHATSKGPVELGPERVEDQVHLVEHERARGLEELDNLRGDGAFFSEFENLTRAESAGVGDAFRATAILRGAFEEPPEAAHVILHRRALELRDVGLVEEMRALEKFERDGFERGGRGDDERPRAPRLPQRVQRRGGERGEPIESKGEDGSSNHPRERGAKAPAAELQKALRHHLHDEHLLRGEHEPE